MLRLLALLAALGLAAGSVAIPTSVSHAEAVRHLRLLAAFPAKDTTLASAPDAVRLWLSEPADLKATRVEVKLVGGGVIATEALTRGAASNDPVIARFTTPPGSGRYEIDWRAMSKDGHVVKGTHQFTVRLAD